MQINEHQKTCWQYQVKIKNFKEDLKKANLTEEDISTIRIEDLEMILVPKEDVAARRNVKDFIERHEWLGKMPARPTHLFIALYEGHIVGVVVMATPYAFTKLLGEENSHLEKLIARGATISWAPKFTGSWLIMKSIKWMVQNTTFRFFSGYSDTAANELGTIYQACNFTYLGKKSGARHEYFDPDNPKKGWFNDRIFRRVGSYRKYAQKLGITWDPSWNSKWSMNWDKVPPMIHAQLAQASCEHRDRCLKRRVSKKHKYTYIQGKDKRQTRYLKKLFAENNPELIDENGSLGLPYPKVRGE